MRKREKCEKREIPPKPPPPPRPPPEYLLNGTQLKQLFLVRTPPYINAAWLGWCPLPWEYRIKFAWEKWKSGPDRSLFPRQVRSVTPIFQLIWRHAQKNALFRPKNWLFRLFRQKLKKPKNWSKNPKTGQKTPENPPKPRNAYFP